MFPSFYEGYAVSTLTAVYLYIPMCIRGYDLRLRENRFFVVVVAVHLFSVFILEKILSDPD